MKRIFLITTGGTIDARAIDQRAIKDRTHYPQFSTMENSGRAHKVLKNILTRHDPLVTLGHTPLMDKDSKTIDDDDIVQITNTIMGTQHDRIIITTGTDRMVDIAKSVEEYFTINAMDLPCPVIFTGAMWPLDNGPEISDGFQNLQQAALHYPDILPGIYITCGDFFHYARYARKDFQALKFVLTDDAPPWGYKINLTKLI